MSSYSNLSVADVPTELDDFASFEPIRSRRVEFMPSSRTNSARRARHRSQGLSSKRSKIGGLHRRGIKYRYGG